MTLRAEESVLSRLIYGLRQSQVITKAVFLFLLHSGQEINQVIHADPLKNIWPRLEMAQMGEKSCHLGIKRPTEAMSVSISVTDLLASFGQSSQCCQSFEHQLLRAMDFILCNGTASASEHSCKVISSWLNFPWDNLMCFLLLFLLGRDLGFKRQLWSLDWIDADCKICKKLAAGEASGWKKSSATYHSLPVRGRYRTNRHGFRHGFHSAENWTNLQHKNKTEKALMTEKYI